MLFAKTETQSMMGDMLARLLDSENAFEARRARLNASPPDRMALWPLLAEQGVLGVGFTEAVGGFGGMMRDIAVVMADIGRTLAVEPYLSTVLGAQFLADVAPVIAGKQVLALALSESFDPFVLPMTKVDGDDRLSGQKIAVRHADLAQALIVSAQHEGEAGLWLVEAHHASLQSYRLIDGASAATVTYANAPARKVGDAAALADLLARVCVGLAAEASGIIAMLNAATFAYLRTRQQFGVPLASFQALQHRAADLYTAEEEVRIVTGRAIDAIDKAAPGAHALASAAKVLTDELGKRVAHEAVQLHGGMGVSDELNISHGLRRLAAIRAECGSAEYHCGRFAALGGASLDESEDLVAFRSEVRTFVQTNLPADIAAKASKSMELGKDDYVRWQKILYANNWFAAAWPKEHGGAGWDLQRQLVFLQEASINNAPMIIPYGVNMVGPVLQAFGSDEQRAMHLPNIVSSDVWWCQGYSEPNAGSDLASLKTSAVKVGDHYVVNGTKMWTTEAHWADWMHCLVRTDKDVKAQHGISFLLIDMKTPGVTIVPIVTIDGQHHTNQIFFDDVRVPITNLVGGEGRGWTIAKFLLSNERVAIADTGPKLRLLGQIKSRLATVENGLAKLLLSHKLAHAEIQLLTLCALEADYVKMWTDGGSKEGPQASVLKIRGTEILQLLTEIALETEGPMGAAHDPADLHLAPETVVSPAQAASMMAHHYLYGRCWSIFGGTNEVQRNIIARAVLG